MSTVAQPERETQAEDDYICFTDIVKHKETDRAYHVIQNWMRNRNTVEFLGVWERLHNADFKPLEFDGFRNDTALAGSGIAALQAGGLAAISQCLSGNPGLKPLEFERFRNNAGIRMSLTQSGWPKETQP